MELGIAVMTKVAHGLGMSKELVRQLYVMTAVWILRSQTSREVKTAMVGLCDRRPANVGVRNHWRRTKDRTNLRKTIEETKPHSGLLSCRCLCVEDGCWSLLWNREVHRWSQKSAVEVHVVHFSSIHTVQLIPWMGILLIVKSM